MSALHPEPPKEQPQEQTVAHQAIDNNVPQPQPENKTESTPEPEKQEDPNWRAFREARKRDREALEAAQKAAAAKEAEAAALKAAMEAAFGKQAPSTQAYNNYYGINQQPEETEEQRIDRMVNEAIAKKEEQYKREQAEHEAKTYPQRLMRDYPDFNQVCSQENLDYLDYHYPELSRTLQRLPDGYDKWHDTYQHVKRFIPNYSTAKKEAARAEVNSQKPRSISSNPQGPTGQGQRETWQEVEQRRAANWERMQRTLKGI